MGRTAPHRKSMLSNMATSLIMNKRITTTVAKAKALRKYVEPILTKAKDDTTHSRRVVFSYLNDKNSVKTLFDEVAEKIADRPGGYTRILKTGNRLGDNADMCIIELVDYNELLLGEAPKKSKTRRSRRGKGGAAASNADNTETKAVTEVAEVEESVSEEPKEVVEESKEATVATEATEVVEADIVVEETSETESTEKSVEEDQAVSSEETESTEENEKTEKDKDAEK